VRPEAKSSAYRASRSVLAFMIVALLIGVVYAVVIRGQAKPAAATAIPAKPLTPGHPVSPSTIVK
jgi:hypothetical protein